VRCGYIKLGRACAVPWFAGTGLPLLPHVTSIASASAEASFNSQHIESFPLLQSTGAIQGRPAFPRRFVVPLASGALAGAGGGGESIESAVDLFPSLLSRS